VRSDARCYSFSMPRLPQPVAEDDRWTSLFAAAGARSVVQAFRLFRETNIEPILIKGWAASRAYPVGHTRIFTDVDLAFDRDDFDRATRIVRDAKVSGLAIDLHNELRHLDTVSWSDLFSNSILVDLEGEEVRVLRDEDHLRVLSVHFLTDGAWYRERLWDIYYAVDRRRPDFDWSRCLDVVAPNRRRWIICVIGLAHRYLDLNVESLPFADEARRMPKWLIESVERQWSGAERLVPLVTVTHDRRQMMRQLAIRFPPEPIYSTIDMEGSFDSRFRIHYQMGSLVKRSVRSVGKLARGALGRGFAA